MCVKLLCFGKDPMAPATEYAKPPPPLAGKSTTLSNAIRSLNKNYCNWKFIKDLLFDPAKLPIVSIGILLVELVLNVFIVQRVKYTEIDWIAYMQECEGFLNGTTNYALLKGKSRKQPNFFFFKSTDADITSQYLCCFDCSNFHIDSRSNLDTERICGFFFAVYFVSFK